MPMRVVPVVSTLVVASVGFVAGKTHHSFGTTSQANTQQSAPTSPGMLRVAEKQTPDLILYCGDFRVRPAVNQWADTHLGYPDQMVWPGVTVIVKDPQQWEATRRSIQLFVKAHGVKKIRIMNHEDCAGHGGSDRHPDITTERQYHKQRLQEAKRKVSDAFPDQEVLTYLVDFDGVHEIQ